MIGMLAIRAVLAVILSSTFAACGSSHVVASESAQKPLIVEMEFEPVPAHVGHERITVSVEDATHTSVTGAVVTVFPSYATVPSGHSMRMLGMGRVAKTIHAIEAGHGLYHADVQLTSATHWTFVVDVVAAGAQATITKNLEVR